MTETHDLERLQMLADSFDCITEDDFCLLANATPLTVETWRKRGTGPAYIRLGRRYLYPRRAVADHLAALTRERPEPAAKGVL